MLSHLKIEKREKVERKEIKRDKKRETEREREKRGHKEREKKGVPTMYQRRYWQQCSKS